MEPVWSSQGHKHVNGDAHRRYQVGLFFMFVYGTANLGAAADHYEKQHWSTRNSIVPGVNSIPEFRILPRKS